MGPGELGDLAAAFDAMAASLDQQEQLRQAMVADVAHELRTPIAVLQAETEALVDGVRAADLEAFTSLHDEALRMGRMVEDLQALASADAAGLSLERVPVDLATVASEAAGTLAGRFRSSGLKLDPSLEPVVVIGDATRLHQVFSNLLANACKFTPAGGEVRLTVSAEGSRARIEVSDTGPGIPPGEQDHVFDRFYRGRSGRRSGGSGIGLAVVKQLVDAHDGEVLLETSPSGGARFVVLLPRAPTTMAHS
jgi:two-component system sensor histidine kinase BaeS